WNSGWRWAAAEPGPKKKLPMAIIARNTSNLPIPQKLVKGQTIITKSTANPNAPGNAVPLAAFSVTQTNLAAANAAVEANKLLTKQLMMTRDEADAAWNSANAILAAFTESATDGDAEKILTTGYDVRAEPKPPQPVAQVQNVKVNFTDTPGHSEVRWKRDPNADAYLVARTPDPITETSWTNLGTVTEAKYEGNGATPGQKYWYRVAGVNRLGQGPWSEPALRPVM
ncbi:MAG: fibronectin type III domain-containing protein, partial [Chthoniobacteraceae bacterium]